MENQTLRLSKGDRAPDFNLNDVDGNSYNLSEALKEGSSLLLIFCHGSGCTVCENGLKEMNDNAQRFEDRGLRLVAITGKPEDYNKELKQTAGLKFPVLSDDGTVAEQYGAVENLNINPTLIIVDRHGIVDWSYVGKCSPSPDWPTLEYIFRHMVMAKGV
jgi:peroxiredoxin